MSHVGGMGTCPEQRRWFFTHTHTPQAESTTGEMVFVVRPMAAGGNKKSLDSEKWGKLSTIVYRKSGILSLLASKLRVHTKTEHS